MPVNKDNISTKLLTVPQAAGYLNVNPGTIRRWAQENRLQGVKVGSRGDWRFTKDELMLMVNSGLTKSNISNGTTNLFTPNSVFSEIQDTSHLVQFYDSDAFLINSIRDFIRDADAAIVVATPEHRAKLKKGLENIGLNLDESIATDKYISLDAAETMGKFMVGGMPDPKRFYETIGGVITRATIGRHSVRIFGEMVAILWAQGNKAAAIRLEDLWNEISKAFSFSLFCAYPMKGFGGNAHTAPFSEICVQHSGVLPDESYASLESTDSRLRAITLLQQKARSLEAEIERRKTLERQKDEFIGIASHELKTPITSVKAYTQFLQKRFLKLNDKKSAELITKMNLQIDKLTKLISDLLDVTRIEEGKLQFREVRFDFNELVSEIIEEMQHTTNNHKIMKEFAKTKNINGDRDRIGQVITNLISNAIKYSPRSNKIIIKIILEKEYITLGVQDFGIGVSKEDQKKVFDRLHRVNGDGQQIYPGLGLGLYICAEIIKRHKGRIWVNSEKGKGSIFCFSLPIGRRGLLLKRTNTTLT